tara:strand:- start:27 stop:782 length:756 start_codon:yes stop_codon:yes gene_type:complete
LVYVNDIEVYRPFLIRSRQQEGFSFIHTDLIHKLEFSAGGFQTKYGGKLSSVLDISYKNPITFNSNVTLSLLCVNASLETISKNKKYTTVTGLRHRDNSLLVNSTQTKSNFKPNFSDFQTYTTYKFSDKFHLNFLGSFSRNSYKNKPLTRQTNFGTINDPKALVVYYNGQEKNNYNTMLAALKASYFITENINLKMYLNLVYNSGLPGGSPNYSDPYVYQSRLRDYKRADLEISYIFADRNHSFSQRALDT